MVDILLIDDDLELCALLMEYLEPLDYTVQVANDGQAGLQLASTGSFDLVVLDVMLPKMDGFEVLRQLRAVSRVPVLMLTARGDEIDRIVGLEMGADDYLAKPFNPRELVARIKAIGRRVGVSMTEGKPPQRLQVGDLVVDDGRQRVLRGGELVPLTAVEYKMLHMLLEHNGQVVSRDGLARQALGRQLAMFDRSVDVHISSLRKKLGPSPQGGERIATVRGTGYRYIDQQE